MTNKHTVAEWKESPFTSYDRRGNIVEHRVVIEHYGGTGADVRHEFRSLDDDSYPDDWTECDAYELRDHGIQNIPRRSQVLRE